MFSNFQKGIKRNYEKMFIDGLNDQINIFHHAINEYPNFSNINHLYSVFENKNIDLVIAIGGEVQLI